jgi:hypothetical protein
MQKTCIQKHEMLISHLVVGENDSDFIENISFFILNLFHFIEDMSCTDDEFKCSDGRCIHISLVCDFKADCVDAADEFCGICLLFITSGFSTSNLK